MPDPVDAAATNQPVRWHNGLSQPRNRGRPFDNSIIRQPRPNHSLGLAVLLLGESGLLVGQPTPGSDKRRWRGPAAAT